MHIEAALRVLPQNALNIALLGLFTGKGAGEAAIRIARAADKCAEAARLQAQFTIIAFRADARIAIAGIFKDMRPHHLIHRVENLRVTDFQRRIDGFVEVFPEAG